MTATGRLAVVGCGIQLGRDIGQRACSEIRQAERVFALVDAFTLDWLGKLHGDVVNLCEAYADDRDRRESYRDMVAAILAAVSEGNRVCAVFYGHPGVFAEVGHRAVAAAREAGLDAEMLPGISSADCLYADLAIDPGRCGIQSFEATQFLVSERAVDPAAVLLLWQVALAGNLACTGFEPVPKRLALLVEKLGRWYPADTGVILYEAARLAIEAPRIEHRRLEQLPSSALNETTTLVIPPTRQVPGDDLMRARLMQLDPETIGR